MFNLFGRSKQSRKTRRSNPNTSRLAKRQLFMESLEDRRLLAADVSVIGFAVNGGGTIAPGAFGGTNLNEGDIVTVDINVDENDDGVGGANLAVDVVTQLDISTVSSLGLVPTDSVIDSPAAGILTVATGTLEGDFLSAFQFTVVNDTVVENTEELQLNFSVDAANTISAPTSFNYTILNDDSASITVHDAGGVTSALTISDVEAALGTQQISFKLNGELDQVLTGDIVSVSGTAVPVTGSAVPGEDYEQTVNGSFTADEDGEGVDAASIVIQEDAVVEEDQSFTVELTNLQLGGVALTDPSLAVYAAAIGSAETATITIENDDSADFALQDGVTSTGAAGINEGDAYTTEIVLTGDIEVPAGTADITAIATDGSAAQLALGFVGDNDFDFASTPFAVSGIISSATTVLGNGDANQEDIVEFAETFSIDTSLPPSLAAILDADTGLPAVTLSTGSVVYTISNEDSGVFTLSSAAAQSAAEGTAGGGGAVAITVNLDAQVQLRDHAGATTLPDLELGGRNDVTPIGETVTADIAVNPYFGTDDYDLDTTTESWDGTVTNTTNTWTLNSDGDGLGGMARQDDIIEFDEDFFVTWAEGNFQGFGSAGTGALTVDVDFTTVTITNDDIGTIDLDAGGVTEITEGDPPAVGGAATWDVTLTHQVQTVLTPAEWVAGTTTDLVTTYVTDDGVATEAGANDLGDPTDGGDDYVDADTTINADGATAGVIGSVLLQANADDTLELDEYFVSTISENDFLGYSPLGYLTIGNASENLIIRNDDDATFSVLPVTAFSEGTDHPTGEGLTPIEVTIELSDNIQDYDGDQFSVHYFTTDTGTAVGYTAGANSTANGDRDYIHVDDVATFAGDAGEQVIVTVNVRADEVTELDESFDFTIEEEDYDGFGTNAVTDPGILANPNTYDDVTGQVMPTNELTLGTASTTFNINNDDSSLFEVVDVTVNEGDGTIDVEIALDYPTDVPLSLSVHQSDGTAVTGVDYTWQAEQNLVFTGRFGEAGTESSDGDGTLNPNANPEDGDFSETQLFVGIPIIDDLLVEASETIQVNIFDLIGAAGRDIQIGEASGTVTIVDNDAAVITLAADAANFTEAGGTATLTVEIAEAVDVEYDFDVMTQDGTAASSDGDYTPTTTNYVVPAETTNHSATFTVPVSADGVVEVPETILAFVNNINAQGRNISVAAPETLTVTSADTATLDINDVTVIEGDEGQALVQMTVTLSNAVSSPVSVVYTTNDGTAVDAAGANYGGDDYDDTDTTTDGSITFVGEAGEQQKINVYVNGDVVVEDDETLTVDLGAVTAIAGVSVGDGSGNLNILNGADAATISIQTASSVLEGDTGAANTGDLIVTLSNPVDTAIAYDFATNDVDAVGDVAPVVGTHDYTTSTGAAQTFTGALGSSLTQTISVPVTGDDLVELNETFEVTIDNLGNPLSRAVTLPAATDTGTVTIVNDDAAEVSITDITVNEDVGTATLTISLSAVVDTDVNIDIATQDGTAVDSPQGALDSDYDAAATTPETFAAGETSKTFDVDINDENLVELDEFLSVLVSNLNASGRDVTVVDDTGIITIVDNDTAELSISLVTVPGTLTEDSGTVTFDIALSNPVAVPVTINYGGVNPLMPSSYDDFVGGAGSVTFETNENATQQVTLDVFDDAVVELDEDFTVQMFGLDAGAIQDADNTDVTIEPTAGETAEFTIIDNDSAIFSINDVSVTEDDHGHDVATLTVTLDTAVDVPVDVQFDTADGTAISSDDGFNGHSDFVAVAAGNLRFAGTAGETQTITIRFNGETVVELDEDFTATLSNVAAQGREVDITIPDPTGTVTIENDDSATVDIQEVVSVNEDAGTADLLVTLSAPVDVDVLVDADHQDDTATETGATAADDDYDTVDETLTYSNVSGSTRQFTVTVPIGIDNIVELDEAMQVVLSNLAASGRDVTIGNGSGDVNILNDDSAVVQIDDVVINEEAGSATLTLTLSAPVDTQTDVNWQTLDGTATAAFNDYIVDGATVSWTALDTTDKTITVTVNDDDIVELTETMHVGLEEADFGAAEDRAVTVSDEITETNNDTDVVGSGQVTIVNTDSSDIEINATSAFFNEGADGITSVTFDVTLTEPIDIPVLINHASRNGDYNSNTNAALANTDAIATDAEYAAVNSTADDQNPSDPIGEYDFVNAARADDHDYDETEGALNFVAINDGLQHDPTDVRLTQTVTVPVYGDNTVELDEWFVQFIESSDNFGRDFSITKSEDYGWINNDDEAHVEISDVSLNEGTGGSKFYSFVVTLDNDVDVPVDVTYDTNDVTATDDDNGDNGQLDYTTTFGTLNFTGDRGIETFETLVINVPVSSDNVVELDEVFHTVLTSITADHRDVTITKPIGIGDILNDDSATVYINDTAVEEGDAGTTTATLTVSLSNPVDALVNVPYTTNGGDATSGVDYVALNDQLTFGKARTDTRVLTIDVAVNGDTDFERHENLYVELGILSTDEAGRDVSYNDDDDRPAAEGRVDITNDDRNLENFIGDCNIQAEPGDVNVNGAARIAQWNFTLSDLDEPIDLVFDAAAATGETVEIGVPQVVDSRGRVVAPLKVGHVDELTIPDAQKSYGVFRLGNGQYTVVVPASNDTDGLIELASSMPGLLSATERTVTNAALQQTAGGVLQTQLGIRGVMPEVFNDRMGIDLGIDQYDACLDSDHNGFLTAFDLMTVDTNVGVDEPGVYFLEDRFTPANLLEVDPLGQDELSIAELFGFSLYQNPSQPLDVNADGNVSPIDALTVINSLNSEGTRSVLVLGDSDGDMGDYLNTQQYLYDTNGDFAITPIDVLSVINHLNGSAGGEGEAVSVSADDFFLGYGQDELATVAVETPVAAAITSTGIDVENTHAQEQYTTPLQANAAWSESVDLVLSDMTDGGDADDVLESLLD